MLGWKVFGSGMPELQVQAVCKDVGITISAAGTTQGTATEMTAADNEVTTVAAGAGVITSQFLASGDTQTVFNAGANALNVYPTSGMKINNLPTNYPMLLPINTGCMLKCVSTTRIFGILSA